MQRYNSTILISLQLLFIISTSIILTKINIDISSFSNYLMTDLELFTSYLFKTHQHYMFLSILLLLLALILSVFLSTKFVISNTKQKNSLIYYE